MFRFLLCIVSFAALSPLATAHTISFHSEPGRIEILADKSPIATYVFQDDTIPRPYFSTVKTLNGLQITRNHPPVEGEDKTDHAEMHPGIWLAFGDLGGADFWRNKGSVRHIRFLEESHAVLRSGAFAVENSYTAEGKEICREVFRCRVEADPHGWFLILDSTFSTSGEDFSFGDQEEMGLGIRMATPLTVERGGSILNSDGKKDEKEAWGQTAAWCQYRGLLNDRLVGAILMPNLLNFRKSWFHVRDYGLMVANPFGRNAFTGEEASAVSVRKDEPFRLRFGIYLYDSDPKQPVDPIQIFGEFLGLLGQIQTLQADRAE